MCVTDSYEHAQLALASVLGVDTELDGKTGRDATGQTRPAGSHFAGIVSWQNPELEGTKETTDTVTTDTDPQGQHAPECGTHTTNTAATKNMNLFINEYQDQNTVENRTSAGAQGKL